MRALAVRPGDPRKAIFQADIPSPRVTHPLGVIVQIKGVGICGTDREVRDGDWGKCPENEEFLVLGHEAVGVVVDKGSRVTHCKVGDWVVPTVRRPIGDPDSFVRHEMPNFTTGSFLEHGIMGLHGFLTEHVEVPEKYLAVLPESLRSLNGLLVEPLSIVQNALEQILAVQSRLRVWQAKSALVVGVGPVGQLAAAALRMQGLDVVACGTGPGSSLKAKLLDEVGVKYLQSSKDDSAGLFNGSQGFDVVIEAAGDPFAMYQCLGSVAKNGVVMLTGIAPDGPIEASVNLQKVGNLVKNNAAVLGLVNSHVEHFRAAAKLLARMESRSPGWVGKLLTHKVSGLNAQVLQSELNSPRDINRIKTFVALDG